MPSNLSLLPGTLVTDCYPASAQAFYDQMFALGHAQLGDITGIIISEGQPAPEDRDKAWIKLVGGAPLWGYSPAVWYNGAWVIKHPEPANSPARKMWAGDAALLPTYDGGDNGLPGDASGPMWEVDHDFDARSPIGPGTLPSTAVITQGQALGEENHVLTEAEGAVGSHTHPYGLYDTGAGSAGLAGQNLAIATAGYNTLFLGGTGPSGAAVTTANMFTTPANLGAGVTSAGHNCIHPSRGVYFIKRTSRIYIRVA